MDEKALLLAMAQLDRDALATAFEAYAPMIFKYAMRVCHDPHEADDVVGETFSRLLDHLAAGKGPRENLRAYLYQTAYHLIVDHARDRRHYSSIEAFWELSTDAPPTPDQAEERRKLKLVQLMIHSVLTPDQQHVIMLRFLEGFDLRETAAILKKEINNVKVTQNRAIAKLREALSKEIEDPFG